MNRVASGTKTLPLLRIFSDLHFASLSTVRRPGTGYFFSERTPAFIPYVPVPRKTSRMPP